MKCTLRANLCGVFLETNTESSRALLHVIIEFCIQFVLEHLLVLHVDSTLRPYLLEVVV